MELPRSSIHDTRKMTAADLFLKGLVQVFSKKTGEYLGYVRPWEDLPEPEDQPEQPAKEPANAAQLSLF